MSKGITLNVGDRGVRYRKTTPIEYVVRRDYISGQYHWGIEYIRPRDGREMCVEPSVFWKATTAEPDFDVPETPTPQAEPNPYTGMSLVELQNELDLVDRARTLILAAISVASEDDVDDDFRRSRAAAKR